MRALATSLAATVLAGALALFFALDSKNIGATIDVAPINYKVSNAEILFLDRSGKSEIVNIGRGNARIKLKTRERVLKDNQHGLQVKIYTAPREYIEAVYRCLREYAPDEMWISAALAQAYTEGGAGRYGIYAHTNNCFGITAGSSWAGRVFYGHTGKHYPNIGAARRDGAGAMLFRVYDDIQQSVKDYIRLIRSSRYCGALEEASPEAYLSHLILKGYGEEEMLRTWENLIYGRTRLITYEGRRKP